MTRTGLTGYLRERGLGRIFVAGLAYDYCVRYSAIDSMRAGFETYVVEDACRAIGVGDSVAATNYDFHEAGARRITSAMLRRRKRPRRFVFLAGLTAEARPRTNRPGYFQPACGTEPLKLCV